MNLKYPDISKYPNQVIESIKSKNKWKQFYYIIIVSWYWRLRIGGYRYSWFWKLLLPFAIEDFKVTKLIFQGKLA